jgi:phage terminase large subunit-like protein
VLTGKLRHGGHPVLRWCAANVTVDTDHAENIKPSKKKSSERIDGIAALVNALTVALPAVTLGSIYDHRAPVLIDL